MSEPQISRIRVFSGDNLNDVYQRAMSTILYDGVDLTFGDKDEVKEAREILGIFQFHGKALKEILKGKTPKGFKYSGSQVKALMDTFLADALNPTGFEYTYPDEIRNQPGVILNPNDQKRGIHTNFDQFEIAKDLLAVDIRDRIQSNRNVGWVGHPGFAHNKDKPCFNWFQLRYMGHKKTLLGEVPMISFRMLFRSHDWGDGVMGNGSSIGGGFDKLVLKPLGAQMLEMVIISASAHLYKNEAQLCEQTFGIQYDRKHEQGIA